MQCALKGGRATDSTGKREEETEATPVHLDESGEPLRYSHVSRNQWTPKPTKRDTREAEHRRRNWENIGRFSRRC